MGFLCVLMFFLLKVFLGFLKGFDVFICFFCFFFVGGFRGFLKGFNPSLNT